MIVARNIILLQFFYVINISVHSRADSDYYDLNQDDYDHGIKSLDSIDLTLLEDILRGPEKVRIQLYYECLCPACIYFDVNEFAPVVETMSSYLDIYTYPFGHAKIIFADNSCHCGKLDFRCQHGPAECYGNKLHACALDKLQHIIALQYNICLMNSTDGSRSDDESADRCGRSMNIDSEPIKECAKGNRGIELLRYYGEESKKAHFSYVPYVLINGMVFNGDDFKNAVCNAFSNPPPTCK